VSGVYAGLKAQAWDLLRGDTSQWADRAFYLDVIARSGEPVLDVGCGTGRLLLDYALEGIDIDGVDNAPEMLALCHAKAADAGVAPRLYEQDMARLDVPRRYRTIIVPSSSLQLIVDPADAALAMTRLRDHLEPGGVIVASFMQLRRPGQPLAFGWVPWGEAPRDDGTIVRRSVRSTFDIETQVESSEERFEVVRDGVVVASETHVSTVRAYTLEQSLALFERAGLTDVHATHNFTFDGATADSAIWCAFGRRA